MKWAAAFVLLMATARVAAATLVDTEAPSYLRQEKKTPRSLGIFQILNYRSYSYYHGGGDRIHDGGSSYCRSDHKCGECEGDCDKVSEKIHEFLLTPP